MAHYFRYKTPQDIVMDARRLGLHHIEVSDDLSPLFAPIRIADRAIGNRWAIQPMEGCDGTLEGLPDELTFRRYHRFGAGGAKLIWGEATAIADEGRMNPRQLWLHDGSANAIERMLAECRAAHRAVFGTDSDLLLGLQLTHSGRFAYRRPMLATHDPILDTLTKDKSTGRFVDESFPLLSDDDFRRIEDQYVVAAKLAAKIGCDFIDLKQCHRYLLSELLASKNRPGDYGGSLENRTRLIRNVIARVRAELPAMILASRFNAYDGIPYRGSGDDFIGEPCPHSLPLIAAFGTDENDHQRDDLLEPIQLARWLGEWGVSLLNVSLGNPYANPHLVRPAEYPPVDGYKPPEHPLIGIDRHFRIAAKIQQAVADVPVVGSGYSWLQEFMPQAAAANVANGHIAIVGLGRGTLSQPDFVKNLQDNGCLDRKRVCRTFSYCTNLMRSKNHPLGQYATGCPPFDKDIYGPIWKEAEAKLKP